ncbi:uncharacterized protein [Amphiura filiformis]|uniref:uncharacterized protein n=1 Tax=Amphiura filiformis TaxID=82378 RepID=UPI003B21B6B4
MLGIGNRLVQAQQASAPTHHAEDESVKAGREAEQQLVELLRKHGVPNGYVYQGLRVPDGFRTRKYEIDVVVLSEYGIYAIEVKNWSGRVAVSHDGKSWVHGKKDINKEKDVTLHYDQVHDNVLIGIQQKAQLLRNHLLRNESCLAEKYFHPRVVFMNSNVQLCDKLKSTKEVIGQEHLLKFLESFEKGLAWSVANSMIPSFITGQLSYSAIESARQGLCTIGTWDVLQLNGGRQLIGDFKSCPHISPNRDDTARLDFKHQRNATVSSVWAVLGYSPQVTVNMYKRNSTSWLVGSTLGSVNVPYNTDVTFRVAGEQVDSKIPVNDIHNITLSV